MSYWGPSYFRTVFLAHEPIFSANNIDDNLVVFVSNCLKNSWKFRIENSWNHLVQWRRHQRRFFLTRANNIDNNFVFRPCSSASSLFVVVVVYYLSFEANTTVSCFILYGSLFLKIVEIKWPLEMTKNHKKDITLLTNCPMCT